MFIKFINLGFFFYLIKKYFNFFIKNAVSKILNFY